MPSPLSHEGVVVSGWVPNYTRAASAYWWLLAAAGALAQGAPVSPSDRRSRGCVADPSPIGMV